MVAQKLYSALSEAEKENLNIYNYVGKDQTRPIHNKFKKRSCHSRSFSLEVLHLCYFSSLPALIIHFYTCSAAVTALRLFCYPIHIIVFP